MDQVSSSSPAPRWFIPAALAALLFELVGCAIFAMQMSVDPALLDPADRATWDAAPAWMVAANGVAVAAGLVGAILLLLRRRQAEPLLLLSFVAVLVEYAALLLAPALRNLTTSDDLFLPFVIAVLSYAVWHFARRARLRGWLR